MAALAEAVQGGAGHKLLQESSPAEALLGVLRWGASSSGLGGMGVPGWEGPLTGPRDLSCWHRSGEGGGRGQERGCLSVPAALPTLSSSLARRWSPRAPRPPCCPCTCWCPSSAATSPRPASRSWCAHAPWESTPATWPWPPSPSAWAPASLAPASTWRASSGRRRRTVSAGRWLRARSRVLFGVTCFDRPLDSLISRGPFHPPPDCGSAAPDVPSRASRVPGPAPRRALPAPLVWALQCCAAPPLPLCKSRLAAAVPGQSRASLPGTAAQLTVSLPGNPWACCRQAQPLGGGRRLLQAEKAPGELSEAAGQEPGLSSLLPSQSGPCSLLSTGAPLLYAQLGLLCQLL